MTDVPNTLPDDASALEKTVASTWEREILEKLAFAALKEQRQARRWRTFVRLAWLLFFVTLAWLAFKRSGVEQAMSKPHTAVVEIRGEIANGVMLGPI